MSLLEFAFVQIKFTSCAYTVEVQPRVSRHVRVALISIARSMAAIHVTASSRLTACRTSASELLVDASATHSNTLGPIRLERASPSARVHVDPRASRSACLGRPPAACSAASLYTDSTAPWSTIHRLFQLLNGPRRCMTRSTPALPRASPPRALLPARPRIPELLSSACAPELVAEEAVAIRGAAADGEGDGEVTVTALTVAAVTAAVADAVTTADRSAGRPIALPVWRDAIGELKGCRPSGASMLLFGDWGSGAGISGAVLRVNRASIKSAERLPPSDPTGRPSTVPAASFCGTRAAAFLHTGSAKCCE
eukprot:Opistho-2@88221